MLIILNIVGLATGLQHNTSDALSTVALSGLAVAEEHVWDFSSGSIMFPFEYMIIELMSVIPSFCSLVELRTSVLCQYD